MTVSALQATLATVTDAVNVTPRTVVGIPPSDLDTPGLIRVVTSGTEITRSFDATLAQP